VIDGFLPGLYFGTGTALELGVAVLDPADPETLERIDCGGTHLLRENLDVPVMVVNTESEAVSYDHGRQADTDRFRFWEIAGASHAGAQEMSATTTAAC
jgi:hypothetical protein